MTRELLGSAGAERVCARVAWPASVPGPSTSPLGVSPLRPQYPNRPWVSFSASATERGWGIPKGRRIRVAGFVAGLLILPIVSAFLNGVSSPAFFVPAALSVMFSLVYLVFSAFPGQRQVLRATDVSNFYSRTALIVCFTGLFGLIAFVVYRLWVRFPD